MKKSFKVVASVLVLAFFVMLAMGSEDADPQKQREAQELFEEVLGHDGP